MRLKRTHVSVLLKVVFVAAILTWMAQSGKLNLAQVGKSLVQWPLMLAMVSLFYAQVGITSWRWNLLLRAQEISLSWKRTWGLMMIGMLFNVVIPGSVGGDLIKGYYILRAAPSRKSHAATSVLTDRVVGLLGLLFVGAFMAVINLKETLRSTATRSLGMVVVSVFLGGLLGLYVAVLASGRLFRYRHIPRLLSDVFGALDQYRKSSGVILVALVLSVLNQGLTCLAYHVALTANGVADMPLSLFFLIVPLGLVTTALPISPAGVGVGQVAFFSLFQMVAPQYASRGADAVTVLQAIYILVCVSGFYWYVTYKNADPSGEPQHGGQDD